MKKRNDDPRKVIAAAIAGEPWAIELALRSLLGRPDPPAARERRRRKTLARLDRIERQIMKHRTGAGPAPPASSVAAGRALLGSPLPAAGNNER
jgi:hypothetical protein